MMKKVTNYRPMTIARVHFFLIFCDILCDIFSKAAFFLCISRANTPFKYGIQYEKIDRVTVPKKKMNLSRC